MTHLCALGPSERNYRVGPSSLSGLRRRRYSQWWLFPKTVGHEWAGKYFSWRWQVRQGSVSFCWSVGGAHIMYRTAPATAIIGSATLSSKPAPRPYTVKEKLAPQGATWCLGKHRSPKGFWSNGSWVLGRFYNKQFSTQVMLRLAPSTPFTCYLKHQSRGKHPLERKGNTNKVLKFELFLICKKLLTRVQILAPCWGYLYAPMGT